MKNKILSVSRLGVNALRLITSRGPRLLITSRNEISRLEEATLKRRAEDFGVRAACAGVGRVSIPKA